jgi:hypothetical protein
MRKLVPGAVERVYDNWLIIGFSPTAPPSEAIFSLVLLPVLLPGRVTLGFLEGAGLPDRGNLVQRMASPILVVYLHRPCRFVLEIMQVSKTGQRSLILFQHTRCRFFPLEALC